jgi:hypothetical protein
MNKEISIPDNRDEIPAEVLKEMSKKAAAFANKQYPKPGLSEANFASYYAYLTASKDQYLKDQKEAYRIAEDTWEDCAAICGSSEINPCYIMDSKKEYLDKLFPTTKPA